MSYWLVKSEPNVFSITDLERDKCTLWDGVRNYQARNFLRAMKLADQVLFYHSNVEPIGVAGVAKVSRCAEPDPSQFDSKSDYYDKAATQETPRWFCPELKFVRKFKRVLPLAEIKSNRQLQTMNLIKKGSRLSVQPVSDKEFAIIMELVS